MRGNKRLNSKHKRLSLNERDDPNGRKWKKYMKDSRIRAVETAPW